MGLFSSIFGFIDSGRAAKSISNANIAAQHGVLGANTSGREDIQRSLGEGRTGVEGAFGAAKEGIGGAAAAGTEGINKALTTGTGEVNTAGQGINTARDSANTTLSGVYDQIRGDNAAGRASGDLGNQRLQEYVKSDPKFSFSYDDYKNDPAFQFQMEQGQNAIQNSASARGLSQGGAVLADLTKYGSGLAATHYGDAFSRAKQQFDTNQTSTLANLQALIGSGNTANTLTANAGLDTGGKIAANTTDAASKNADLQKYLATLNSAGQESIAHLNTSAQESIGDLGVSSQTALANLGLQGGTTLADLGLKSAKAAGDYAVGAGTAHGAGILGQGAALGQGVSDLAGLFTGSGIVKGAGKRILGGLFG